MANPGRDHEKEKKGNCITHKRCKTQLLMSSKSRVPGPRDCRLRIRPGEMSPTFFMGTVIPVMLSWMGPKLCGTKWFNFVESKLQFPQQKLESFTGFIAILKQIISHSKKSYLNSKECAKDENALFAMALVPTAPGAGV